jgi:hypothetical protein
MHIRLDNVMQALQRRLELSEADDAPRAYDIGDEVDLKGFGHAATSRK